MTRAPTLPPPDLTDFRSMVDNAAHGICIHHNFRPLYANDAFAALFGFQQSQGVTALPLLRPLIPHENWPQFEADYDALAHGKNKQLPLLRRRLLCKDGQEIWVVLSQRRTLWQGQTAVEWHVFDISAQTRTEQQLLASEQRLRAILEVLPYPILIARRDGGQVLFVNRKSCLLLEQSAAGLLKSKVFDFFTSDKDHEDFLTLLATIQEVREQEMTLQARGGRNFVAEIAAITIDYNGQPALLMALNDISARKRLEEELFHQASTDSLTGISNRRYFMARGDQELRRARRFARPLAVMMIDIDHFKGVNDTHGHAGGDEVLRVIVKFCIASLRGTDSIGRLGGEEFATLMPETELRAAAEVADRLRQYIASQPIAIGDKIIHCTVSIGIAALQPQDTDMDTLLQRADHALYLAKHAGRNQVIVAE
ncbi:MAG: sensor domain-containing diguanylate cyclase [Alphaproteobacteria bacterium]